MANELENLATVGPTATRAERIAKIGTVVSAILASSCCWLPLLLLAVGVSGAGIAATLGKYRGIFMTVTFAFLAMAFYFTYRPRRARAGAADCCSELDCCAANPNVEQAASSASKRRFNTMAFNKVMLWLVTVLAVAFLFFPKYFASMISPEDEFTADMTRTELKVEGMTCDGCVPPAAKAIREVAGVLAVKIDYATEKATVGTAADKPVPKEEILAKLETVGFSGEFTEP